MITIVHRLIGGLGRVLITAGLLTVAFAVFRYWGTGLAEARAQEELDSQFTARLAAVQAFDADVPDADVPDADVPDAGPTADTTPAQPQPADTGGAPDSPSSEPMPEPADVPVIGEAAGRIIIPSIGVDKTYVHGVGRDDLRKGPGHYPQTVFPGQSGNAAIAGHRTTYGAPFFDLDKLVPGDEIIVETLQGRFTYTVEGHELGGDGDPLGHFIVDPTATWVLDDHGDSRLTLTACHPKRSAAQRIVVTATLDTVPAAPTPSTSLVVEPLQEPGEATETADQPGVETDVEVEEAVEVAESGSLDEPLGWRPEHWPAVVLWAALSASVAAGGWVLARRWRRFPAYAVVAGPFVLCLFICFTHLDRLLPAA